MNQVKVFSASNEVDLEKQINNFLQENNIQGPMYFPMGGLRVLISWWTEIKK